MRCSHCGICCKDTQMLLSEFDIKLLENAGHARESFVRQDRRGFAKLRNVKRHCVFYDLTRHRCNVYSSRPLGCRLYPVIYSEKDGVIVDYLCPKANTVSKQEIDRKEARLIRLLKRIDNEAKGRNASILT